MTNTATRLRQVTEHKDVVNSVERFLDACTLDGPVLPKPGETLRTYTDVELAQMKEPRHG